MLERGMLFLHKMRTACFSLEEYHTAKTVFEAGCKLAPDDAGFTYRITKCEKCIAGVPVEKPMTEKNETTHNTLLVHLLPLLMTWIPMELLVHEHMTTFGC